MKNTLSIKTLPNKCVQTDIATTDGVTTMEIHLQGLYESLVLQKLVDKKYYQHFRGSWVISFPDDGWSAEKSTFEDAVAAGDIHIFTRDNSVSYDGFC